MPQVSLLCPLCGGVVVEDAEPAAGTCPTCGALVAGGGETPPAAVAIAARAWGAGDLPSGDLARRLFEVEPAPVPTPTAAITSDRRDAFYLWWVFVRPGEGGPGGVLRDLLRDGGPPPS